MNMRGINKYACLFLFAIALLISHHGEAAAGTRIRPISPSGTEVAGDQWLLVIGIDTYIYWPRLQTAANDAKSVRDALLSRYHFDKDHLIELYNEQATRKNILGKLRFLAKNVDKDDSLVIFYAGHGHLDSITKTGSWIPVEGGIEDASAWISNHDIKNYLRVDVTKAKHILLISDSCFSGDFFRSYRSKLPEVTDQVIKKAYELTSRQSITSGGLEPVSDAGFGRNSIFSHFLVETLKENQKPFLVPSDLFPPIKAGVAENAEQFPRFGSLRDTGGQQGGEIVLFLKQDSRLKDLSAEAANLQKELDSLKQMEAASEEARTREAAEIAKREREVADLDAKIVEIKNRMGTRAIETGYGLESMLAMIQQKEQQQKRIDELKIQTEAEEDRRRAEIGQLKAQNREKRIAAVKEDIGKYKKIVASRFGEDMKDSAWKSLIDKYPEAEGLESGDIEGLLPIAVYGGLVNTLGMKFVRIPAGSFIMGSPCNEPGRDNDARPHRVTITKPYYMQTTEVTQQQWDAVMGTRPWSGKEYVRDDPDCPAVYISWNDCQEFIKKLNEKEGDNKYRLPTEAEWEYACRADSTTKFCFGDSSGLIGNYAWYTGNADGAGEDYAHRVGTKNPNAWGLYDMHGNVWEWCQDWKHTYPSGHVTDPTGPSSGSRRVFRGGSWGNGPLGCRSADRLGYPPRGKSGYVGFRLIRTL